MKPLELGELLKLSPVNSRLLEQRVQCVEFDQAGPVIHKGQSVSGAYIVLVGQLRVFTYAPDGSEATLYLLNPGETCVLTLNCLFNDLRYPAWVEASACSRVAFIPGDLYRKFFAEETQVRETILSALSTVVFRLMDELEEVHTCNLEQRVARYLLNHASDQGVVVTTQQELANRLGTSREVIARLMQGFKEKRVVTTSRGKIKILDEVALASLVTPAEAEWPC